MTEKTLIRTQDLGHDWYANAWSDGSCTLRNSTIGQRIDLSAESADLFVRLWKQARAEAEAAEWPHVGPYEKRMKQDESGAWWWQSYKGPVGPHASRGACEDNICIHCGD